MKEGRAGQGRAAEHARAPARGEEDPARYNGRSEGRRPASCAPADRAREEGGATLPTTNRSDVRPTSERPPPAPHRQNSPTDVGAGTQRWHPQPVPQPVAAGVPRGGTEEGSGEGVESARGRPAAGGPLGRGDTAARRVTPAPTGRAPRTRAGKVPSAGQVTRHGWPRKVAAGRGGWAGVCVGAGPRPQARVLLAPLDRGGKHPSQSKSISHSKHGKTTISIPSTFR